ncbi:MAG: diguanylate cyclase, partial [Bacilli bacterium]|nr:diguanylate cyclase [Bacilli bacterium]
MDLAPYQAVRNLEEYDSFDDIIIVEDALTHESIFQNKAYREETANYKNANRPSFESRFLSVTSFRKEFAGRNLVVEVATRVRPQSSFPYDGALRTAITKIEEQIRQEIQTDIYEGLAPSKKHHKYLQEVVDITMRYYECPFAHVVLLKGQRQATLAAYAGEGEPGISKVAFESYWDNSQTNFFQYGYSLLLEDMAGFAAFDPPLYEKLKENGVHTVLMIPFFIEARQVGFLLLANPRSKKQGFDLFLGDFAANAIGTLLYHGQLYDSLYYDPLTKLPYSDLLETQFPYLKKHFAGKPIAMMGFDIRHFHTYSRSYGLEKGDELLVHISEILRQRYPKDLIFRKRGTDSFLVFASALAGSLANDAKAIQKEIQSMHPETLLAMSFGIYQISPEEEVFRVIGLKVNFAHKRAKDLRGSGIAVFDDKMAERESYERYLTDHFREGLEKEQFEVFLQPRYNLETSTYFSGEALVRWR